MSEEYNNGTFDGVPMKPPSQKASSVFDDVVDEVVMKPPKIFFYATEGIGKSSWAASAQYCGFNPIVLPTEDGVKYIKCKKFPVAKSVKDVNRRLDGLLSESHSYNMLILDTVDWLERLIYNQVCEENNIKNVKDLAFGNGYVASMPIWEDFLVKFDRLIERGIAVALLAHTCINKVEDPDGASYDHFAPKLHVNSKGKGIMKTFTEWADCLLFGNFEKFTVSDDEGFNRKRTRVTGIGKRMIYTTKQAAFNAKNRFSLPPEIPMGDQGYSDFGIFWEAFCNSPVFK